MAFVPHHKHDVFVSYAHVDDQPLPGAEDGWVTTLVKGLKTRLAQRLGRSDAYSPWIDHELSGHVRITPQTLDTLRETAMLLVILSPGYVACTLAIGAKANGWTIGAGCEKTARPVL